MPDRHGEVTPYARGDLLYLVTQDENDEQSVEVFRVRFES